jgi:hypothetical protein
MIKYRDTEDVTKVWMNRVSSFYVLLCSIYSHLTGEHLALLPAAFSLFNSDHHFSDHTVLCFASLCNCRFPSFRLHRMRYWILSEIIFVEKNQFRSWLFLWSNLQERTKIDLWRLIRSKNVESTRRSMLLWTSMLANWTFNPNYVSSCDGFTRRR